VSLTQEELNRLRWRCVRRGLLEVDITLERFLDEKFSSLNDEQVQVFVELADMDDHELWGLINGTLEPATPQEAEVLAMLRK
jgi:succinate dehydrogenase flavin-adding protein (antitoxin of CptAB toxin-antitoxin module)